ncbi:hypothetical protein DPMN_020085, partial [Dreissena polymorpha]
MRAGWLAGWRNKLHQQVKRGETEVKEKGTQFHKLILIYTFFTKHMTCGREDIKKWPVSKAVEDFLRKCEVHEDETLTQFCHDHSQLCCSACVGIIH